MMAKGKNKTKLFIKFSSIRRESNRQSSAFILVYKKKKKKLWTQRRRLGNISNFIFRLITVNYLMQKGKS